MKHDAIIILKKTPNNSIISSEFTFGYFQLSQKMTFYSFFGFET